MAQVLAVVSLAAHPLLTCSVMSQRITITPGNVHPGGLGVYGPLTNDSSVLVPGLSDGIFDT
jgi:hypothetical protein